jgi:hypothetical protein
MAEPCAAALELRVAEYRFVRRYLCATSGDTFGEFRTALSKSAFLKPPLGYSVI